VRSGFAALPADSRATRQRNDDTECNVQACARAHRRSCRACGRVRLAQPL